MFAAPDSVQYRQRPSSIGLQALNGNDNNLYLLPSRQRLSASPHSSHHSRATSLYCDSVIVENEMSEFATRVRRVGMLCLLGAFVIIFFADEPCCSATLLPDLIPPYTPSSMSSSSCRSSSDWTTSPPQCMSNSVYRRVHSRHSIDRQLLNALRKCSQSPHRLQRRRSSAGGRWFVVFVLVLVRKTLFSVLHVITHNVMRNIVGDAFNKRAVCASHDDDATSAIDRHLCRRPTASERPTMHSVQTATETAGNVDTPQAHSSTIGNSSTDVCRRQFDRATI